MSLVQGDREKSREDARTTMFRRQAGEGGTPNRPSTGVLEALQRAGSAHNLDQGGGSIENMGLVQGDR